jgi:hypothetical protein
LRQARKFLAIPFLGHLSSKHYTTEVLQFIQYLLDVFKTGKHLIIFGLPVVSSPAVARPTQDGVCKKAIFNIYPCTLEKAIQKLTAVTYKSLPQNIL